MTDQDVRDLLERMAAEEPIPFFDAAPLTRRAYRRAARTLVMGAVGVVAAIAVLFAGVAEIRTAPLPADQPTPTVTQLPSPFTERFDSPLNGLSIGYPSGWQTRGATQPWGHDALAFDAPDVDVIYDPTFRQDLYLAVVSEPLGGTSGRDWVRSDLPSVGICNEPVSGSAGGSFTLDGADGYIEGCGGEAGTGNAVIVATGMRGYIIYLHVANERRLQETYDRDWFEAALETVDLPSPFSVRFDSPLHGLSIGYPSGWQTRAATEPWGHDTVAFDAPDVDVIFDPTFREDLYLALVSEPLGGQPEGWITDVYTDYSSLGICNDGGGGGGGDDWLDGNHGWFEVCDNDSVAIIQTATRGYIIYLHVGDGVPATYPVPDFEGSAFEETPKVGGPTGLLETLDLRSEAAVDTLNPSQPP
jgi:hypothetical protein